jgi:hypothetical protein
MKTYYLSSLDSHRFSPTRECVFIKRLRFGTGKECALVHLSPGVVGQEYGSLEDLEFFVLANRHEGESLFSIKSFPCFVFISRPLVDNVKNFDEISSDDVEIIAWGELYRSKYDADNHVFDQQ